MSPSPACGVGSPQSGGGWVLRCSQRHLGVPVCRCSHELPATLPPGKDENHSLCGRAAKPDRSPSTAWLVSDSHPRPRAQVPFLRPFRPLRPFLKCLLPCSSFVSPRGLAEDLVCESSDGKCLSLLIECRKATGWVEAGLGRWGVFPS